MIRLTFFFSLWKVLFLKLTAVLLKSQAASGLCLTLMPIGQKSFGTHLFHQATESTDRRYLAISGVMNSHNTTFFVGSFGMQTRTAFQDAGTQLSL